MRTKRSLSKPSAVFKHAMMKQSEKKTYEPRHEKTCFFLCENKGADQLHVNIDSTIPLLPKSEISSL